jgi:hypothetical protein
MTASIEPSSAPSASRFILEVEALVRSANREAIAARLPPVTRDHLKGLIARTAELRADYLAAAFEPDWSLHGEDLEGLAVKRRRFEEAVAAFEALARAVRRDYIEIAT